jgi:hypothetical protein
LPSLSSLKQALVLGEVEQGLVSRSRAVGLSRLEALGSAVFSLLAVGHNGDDRLADRSMCFVAVDMGVDSAN